MNYALTSMGSLQHAASSSRLLGLRARASSRGGDCCLYDCYDTAAATDDDDDEDDDC